jgi:hypothetical protein
MYFTARAHSAGAWPPPPTELNLYQAVPVTLVLIASSFTCQMGVFAAERGDVFGLRRWYTITLLMGTFFVLPVYLQVVLGFDAFETGKRLLLPLMRVWQRTGQRAHCARQLNSMTLSTGLRLT